MAVGLTEVGGTRRFLLAAPGVYLYAGATVIDRSVTIYSDGASFERNGAGHVLEILGPSATVKLVGATVHNAGGAGLPDGIRCSGGATLALLRAAIVDNLGRGIDSTDCRVNVDRTVIASNRKAGLRLQRGQISVTNSIVVGNGTSTETVGGLELAPDLEGSRVEFTTIRKNLAASGRPGGIDCSGTDVIARNNIIFGSVNTDIETLGSCIHSFSIVGPLNTPTGVEVIPGALAALAFANPNGSSAPAVHLLSGSIARGIADPSSTTAVDYDGDSRPNPAGSRADIGADEVP